ncbi:helix-turn-helix domain-containing protein [Streptomyces sp. 1222.5]|uniref:helix-turn-helix domain-containing protein n=1 Tax=Streptomyces sp. 1222.5 TaxID=1881026 RepID=UPI003D7088EB
MTSTSEAAVRSRYPDINPEAGPGAARRWARLVRLAEVAQEYREAQAQGESAPAAYVAKRRGVAHGTIRTWLHQAKKEGFDVPGRHGAKGSTGRIVRTNIRTLREQRRMTYVELAAQLDEAGQRVPVLGLRRLEAGERRVDVDELVAFAAVFGITAAQLLEPLPECDTCHGAPPPGFVCATCGAGPVRPDEEPTT